MRATPVSTGRNAARSQTWIWHPPQPAPAQPPVLARHDRGDAGAGGLEHGQPERFGDGRQRIDRRTPIELFEPLDTGIPATTLDSRDRLSDPNSSADVVVDPASDIRSPVSGTVISTGTYNLYCDLDDFFINIEPDDHPGWKVRIIHIMGVNVQKGDRVEAGVTVVAPGARILPFASQVDDLRTVDPAWPHVHMEVVDPSVPNVPNGGSGYENC